MNDPVAEAVQRAWDARRPGLLKIGVHMENAAREALKPIQEWMAEIDSEDMLPGHVVIAALAPLIYATEELR